MKPETKQKKKIGIARKLAKAAMIDKPKWKAAKGFTYIKDVEPGELIKTSDELQAIVIEHTNSSTITYCTKTNKTPENEKFYLGRHRWGNETEVKIVKD